MTAPNTVVDLVERYQRHATDYASSSYNETQVRREFIDPFFETLGWDINNKQGYAEAYKDVIHEDTLKIGGMTRAPDYAFRIGGTRKFFLEAKKTFGQYQRWHRSGVSTQALCMECKATSLYSY